MSFTGFEPPTANFTRVPNVLFDEHLSAVSSLAELKVVLYVIRHTWGWTDKRGNYDTEKRITLDELCHGRKRRDGTRLDQGVGMSTPAVNDGIQRAIADGFIWRRPDGRDRGRSSYYYGLVMQGDQDAAEPGQDLAPASRTDALAPAVDETSPQESLAWGQEVLPQTQEVLPRSEKDTLKDTAKDKPPPALPGGRAGAAPAPTAAAPVLPLGAAVWPVMDDSGPAGESPGPAPPSTAWAVLAATVRPEEAAALADTDLAPDTPGTRELFSRRQLNGAATNRPAGRRFANREQRDMFLRAEAVLGDGLGGAGGFMEKAFVQCGNRLAGIVAYLNGCATRWQAERAAGVPGAAPAGGPPPLAARLSPAQTAAYERYVARQQEEGR